jgi:hypothetical protein
MRRLEPPLEPGRVYRTKEFGAWAKNPFALATRLVAEGKLRHLGHGLYHHPANGLLGPMPPKPAELVRAFLGGRPFLFGGTVAWNRLALGTTQAMVHPLVYNTERSGVVTLAERTFTFKRTRFPADPTPEWFAVDLLNNLNDVPDADPPVVVTALRRRLGSDFDRATFATALAEYGTRRARMLVRVHRLLDEMDQPHAA